MSKILVVFTGGTIGSKQHIQTIDVDQTAAFDLLQKYEDYKPNVQFETIQPLHILSENWIQADWSTLMDSLSAVEFDQYTGIIITHGTDTLSYTAAAVSYAFSHVRIPIVLVSSNYPLNDPRSNGLRNFVNAIDFIKEKKLPGIFVVFENDKRESIIYLGTRLMQSLPFTDQFNSPYAVPFGFMQNQKFQINVHPLNPTLNEMKTLKKPVLSRKDITFSDEILYIKPFPGMNYSYYDFSVKKPKAVLHDLYHSGTACTRFSKNGSYSLLDFSDYCRSQHVKLYMAPLKSISEDLYSSLAELIAAGITPAQNITVEAYLTKLILAYGSFKDESQIEDFLERNLFFETVK